jgi:hypothetical protein
MATANVHKLVLIKPVNEAMPEQSSYAPRPAGLQGKRVGLLDNSKNHIPSDLVVGSCLRRVRSS